MTDGIETFRWEQLASRQKIYIAAAVLLLLAVIGYGLYDRWRLDAEVRQFEREAAIAKAEAQAALTTAANIAREKVEQEKKLEETESKRDVKRREEHEAKARSADARLEYHRSIRERRGDNPTVSQLCSELAALGHPC